MDVNMLTEEIADGTEFLKSNYSVHPFSDSGVLEDVFGLEDLGAADAVVENCTAHKFQKDPKVDPALSEFLQEYEAFELKIFHRKNRLPIRCFSCFHLLPQNSEMFYRLIYRCLLQDRL